MKRPVTFVIAAVVAGLVAVVGVIPIVFDEWNIQNPSGGPAETEDRGELEFLLVFAR